MNQKSTEQSKLLVIGGPTGVGKTSLSIALANHYSAEIFSADSRQLYKELRIGVARPTEAELLAVKHHFIASHSIDEPLNAGSYASEALAALNEYFDHTKLAVLCGGTGLYIKSLCEGLDILPRANDQLRSELKSIYHERGITALQARYESSKSERDVDLNNPQRLMRAIEIAESQTADVPEKEQRNFNVQYFYLDMNRERLYKRINQRVDLMMEHGLLKEVKSLVGKSELKVLQTVGYSELFDHLNGVYTLNQAVEKIKQHSRNYAKRQITWFKNQQYKKIDLEQDNPLEALIKSIDADQLNIED